LLEELGCDAIQGFLLGTPRAAAEYDVPSDDADVRPRLVRV
jgi:EAL domain-containing protein (putative c-di-GMP-specific phosphodiesterase class I)